MNDCIESTGCKHNKGYRTLHVPLRGMVYAHRVAYCDAHGLALGDIAGQVVRHKCDNRACVNPDHLEIGTYADNSRDMVERGRVNKGADRPLAKLTDELVAEIRARYVPRCHKNGGAALARELGVGQQAVSQVVTGSTWRHTI